MLDTTGLSGVIHHNPGDMTVSVRAGTPLRDAGRDELGAARPARGVRRRPGRRRAPPSAGCSPPADAGPSALVYGSLRDLVIGMTMVLADGTVARSGGHVIKNVAGYDLAKLLHGSYGTLGVLAEVVLRLHPVPEGDARPWRVECPLDEAAEHAARLLRRPATSRPRCEWVSGDPARLLVRLEGTRDALPGRVGRLARAARPGAHEADAGVWARARGADGGRRPTARPARPVRAVLRIGTLPARLPGARRAAARPPPSPPGCGTGVATVDRCPARRSPRRTTPCTPRAAPRCCATARTGSTRPAWGPPPSGAAPC